MTLTAVRERFGKIRSTIPRCVMRRRRLPTLGRHEEQFPGAQHIPLVERKCERVLYVPGGHRPQGRKAGADGENAMPS